MVLLQWPENVVHDHSVCAGMGKEKAAPTTSNFMFNVVIITS